jgi:DNA-binding LytR/AlgR family response regulator
MPTQTTYTCLIVDDEPPAARVLLRYLQDYPQLRPLKACYDPSEALERISAERPDLLFLDIQMPGITGLNLLRSLPDPPLCILATAFPEFALEGFELEALDYLLKPVSPERFAKALRRALDQLQSREARPREGYLTLKVDRKQVLLPYSQIWFVQSLDDYVKIFSAQGTFVPRLTLTHLENELPKDQFQRIHRSYLVNSAVVEQFDAREVQVGGQKLPLGKSYRKAILALWSK